MSRAPRVDVTLSEFGGIRYLHFGSEWVQGAMRLSRPFDLELAYVRQMMAWLLFLEPPAEILQLGLGAASLTKFCHQRLAPSRVTAVELSDEVIDAARAWFALPPDDARLRVVQADAGHFLKSPAARGRFGVVQVDLYDRAAAGPVLDSLPFYRRCREALAEPGIVVVNLFGEHHSYERSRERLDRVFGGRLLRLAPVPEGNTVVMGFAGPPLEIPVALLTRRAEAIEAAWGLPARRWLSQLQRDPDVPALRRGDTMFRI